VTAVAAPAAGIVPDRRRGPGPWFGGFRLMLLWNVVRMRLFLPILVLVQMFAGVGLVLGFSLLYSNITAEQALYLGTGAVVITLVTVGIVMGPQLIAEQRLSGSYDWYASLPVPRSASAAAWTVFNVIVALPGAAAALLAVRLRFDAALHINLLLIPGVVLVLTAGTLIGYSYAHLLPNPRTIGLISQVMIFVILGFSPIAYPARNLPDWLSTVHTYLPFFHMGEVSRAGLTVGLVHHAARSFVVLGAWAVVAAAGSAWALRKRP
jgi:ABC-2 type transport system permease protein